MRPPNVQWNKIHQPSGRIKWDARNDGVTLLWGFEALKSAEGGRKFASVLTDLPDVELSLASYFQIFEARWDWQAVTR